MSKMICIDAFRERSSYRSATQRPQSKIVALIRHALRALPNWLAEARQMQQAFETMSAMSDRELEDIGITRSDIPAVVARTIGGMRHQTDRTGLIGHRGTPSL